MEGLKGAYLSLPTHLLAWSDILTDGWPDSAGPAPDETAVANAVRLGAKPGDKNALAWAMYCRPNGATREEVVAACGGPHMNRAVEYESRGVLEFRSASRPDGKTAYFLGEPGSNPGGPGARRVGRRASVAHTGEPENASIADRIRRYVVEKYIQPARARGESEVSIRAGTVHDELSLTANWANVCQTLAGAKLQNLAAVPAPRQEGAAASPATVFTFRLSDTEFTHENVENLLKQRFSPVSVGKKMVAFRLADGRELAFDREVRPAQLWVELPGTIPPSFSSEIYSAQRPRHHGLPPRLKHAGLPGSAARRVAKVSVSSFDELKSLLAWYAEEPSFDHEETRDVSMAINAAPFPTNLILYGPPGTGKTYATVERAVQICDDSAPSDRASLMERYRELVARKRIGFVTFHQSYSYEDFVEGLRPSHSDGEGSNSPGFSLRPHPGVFRKIADLAKNNRGAATEPASIDRSRQIFKMSLGRSAEEEGTTLFREAIEGNYVLLGYGGEIDWSEPQYANFEAIKERWRREFPSATGQDPNIQQTYALRAGMKEGDYIVVSDGNKKFRAIGQVVGDYKFVRATDHEYYHHRRPVRWLWHSDQGLPRELIYKKGFSQVSVYQLDASQVDWPALEQIVSASGEGQEGTGIPEPYVLIIDEINRANVSKVFGELITLIEPDKRIGGKNELILTLPYSQEPFGVPPNLHIVGTMNTADRSIALLDTALRRRFEFEELMPQPELLRSASKLVGVDLVSVLSGLNARIEYLFDREHQVGHAFFMDCVSADDLSAVMRTKVIPLLTEYFYEDWEKVRQVLGETQDDGAFIKRVKLAAPRGADAEETQGSRWSYFVQPVFAASGFEQLKL